MELSVRGFERYTSWMKDADAGPTGNGDSPRGPGWSANDVEYDCGNAVTEALGGSPVTFDAAARQYHQALLALQAVAEPVDRYYRREEFRRDGGAGMRRQLP